MDEDAVLMAIGGLTAEVKNLGKEMGEIKTGIQNCQSNCKESREKVSKRIANIERLHTEEEAVTSWLDTTSGRVSLGIGIASGIVSLIILAWPMIAGAF